MVCKSCVHITFIKPWSVGTRAPLLASTFLLVAQTTLKTSQKKGRCELEKGVPTPVTLRQVRSRVPTPGALRQVHLLWFMFGHTHVWVRAPFAVLNFINAAAPTSTCLKSAYTSGQHKGTHEWPGFLNGTGRLFLGAQMRTELLPTPAFPEVPYQKGTKSELAASSPPSQGP